MLLIRVLLASWRQQWRQVLLVVFGLLCASAGLSSVLALNETARQKMSQLDTPFAGKPKHLATLIDGNHFSKSDYAQLLKMGWQIVGLSRFQPGELEQPLPVVAMDVAALLTQIQAAHNQQHDTASSTASTAKNMDFSLWQTPLASSETVKNLAQSTLYADWNLPLPVVMPQIKDNNLYLSMTLAGTLEPDINVNELWVFSSVDKHLAQRLKAAGFDIQLISTDTGTLTDSFYINITAMGLLMFSVSMFISLNAYNLLFSGRKSLIRQLYLMGVNTKRMHILFAVEGNLLAFVCCTIGFAMGLALAELISPGMELTLRNLYEASFTEQQVSFLQVWVTVIFAGLVAVNTILWIPVNQVFKQLNLTDRAQHSRHSLTVLRHFLVAHGLLISIAALAVIILIQQFLLIDSLVMSFFLITACVLSGCIIVLLLMPTIMRFVRQRVSPQYPLLYYFSADAVRLSDKSRIAVCAFFIAITANIGMNLMVGSFRSATDGWIAKQFVADFYLSTNEPEQFEKWAAKQTDINVYHRTKSEIAFEGRKTEVLPLPEDIHGHLPLLFKERVSDEKLTAKTFEGGLIYVNEQMAIRHQLRVAQTISLGNKHYNIAGIYYDYGNMFNQVLLARTELANFVVDDSTRQLYSISLQNDSRLSGAQLANSLETLEVSLFSGKQIKDISMNVFEQTFVITSGLNLITLLVAGASLATSIIIIESQNQQQTRVLQQMGVSERKIWFGSLMQYGYLITVVFFLSVPFGILLSYQLINNINYAAFQWSYPLKQDPMSYVFVYGIALFTVLVAVTFPVLLKRAVIQVSREHRYG